MEFSGQIVKNGGDFKSPGEGVHIMGLVAIKDCIKKYKEDEKPGIQFTFRLAKDAEVWVNHRVTTALNPKSNLYKTLRRMAPKLVTESTSAPEVMRILEDLENKWYEVSIVEAPGKDGQVWANIDDCLIRPARPDECPDKAPLDYFASTKAAAPKVAQVTTTKNDDDIPF